MPDARGFRAPLDTRDPRETAGRRPRSVLRAIATAALPLALLGATLTLTGTPASGSTAVSGPVTHPENDTMGSTIRAHEPQAVSRSLTMSPHATGSSVSGMDVSHHQGSINWSSAYSKGARFVYMKATEGTGYVDNTFTTNYSTSAATGFVRGAYHFALPDRSSGATQANYFVAHGGGWSADGKTLPPMLDIEYNPYGSTCYGLSAAKMSAWIKDFSTTVHARTGRYPTIYSTAGWWNSCTGSNTTFGSANALFLARYSSSPGTMPAGWRFHTIWQFNDRGPLPGDQDLFNGSMTQLRTFATGGKPPVTAPVTPPTSVPPKTTDPISSHPAPLPQSARIAPSAGRSPSLTAGANGRLDLTARKADGSVQHSVGSTSGTWHATESLGGVVVGAPTTASARTGELSVFVRGKDNGLWYRTFSRGSWSGWTSLGGRMSGSPAAVSPATGRVDVYVTGAHGVVYRRSTSGGPWSSWRSVGGHVAADATPAAATAGSGTVALFARDTRGNLTSATVSAAGSASGWSSLAGPVSGTPAAASTSTGTAVFVKRSDRALWTRAHTANGWSPWKRVGGVLTSSPAATGRAGRIDVIALGGYSKLWQITGGTSWSAWHRPGA